MAFVSYRPDLNASALAASHLDTLLADEQTMGGIKIQPDQTITVRVVPSTADGGVIEDDTVGASYASDGRTRNTSTGDSPPTKKLDLGSRPMQSEEFAAPPNLGPAPSSADSWGSAP